MSNIVKRNSDWLTIAEENEIPLYSQQPEETEKEFALWLSYRDQYPNTKPTMKRVSEVMGIPYGTVKTASAKWDWQLRLKAWAKHLQDLSTQQRQQSIVAMNNKHIEMSAALQEKLKVAIDQLDPYQLQPKDINALMKTAAELERKAYDVGIEEWKPELAPQGNKDIKESPTKKEDISEVMSILAQAGLFSGKKVGIEQTTRVVVDGD